MWCCNIEGNNIAIRTQRGVTFTPSPCTPHSNMNPRPSPLSPNYEELIFFNSLKYANNAFCSS